VLDLLAICRGGRAVIVALRQGCACGGAEGEVRPTNGQNCVYCVNCQRYAGYNASKTETGEKPRSVSGDRNVKPKQAYRIRERATGRCELCGTQDGILVVDHILSVADGEAAGLSALEINHDENLCLLCESCNAGKGRLSMSPRLYIALLKRRTSCPPAAVRQEAQQ
jgi:hypothetical protein